MNDPAQRSAEIKLDSIIAEYLRLTDAGQQVDVESFLAAHQEVAEEFREFLGGIQVIDQHGPRGIALPTKDTLSAQVSGDTEVLLGRSKDELAGTSPLDPDDRDFGRYILQRKLGEGAMGTVFLAEDTALNRMVALKQPRFAPNDDRSIKERFFREARAVAMLDHPNVCPVYDIGEHDGIPYLTMTFIEGRTLKQMLDETPQISERQATTLIRGIANGLAQAHERGIMHRDLKPGNIMISQRNEPVVMDFGLARQFNRTTETPLTEDEWLARTYSVSSKLTAD